MISTTFLIVLAYSIERIVAMAYVHEYDEMWTKRPTLGISLYLVAVGRAHKLNSIIFFYQIKVFVLTFDMTRYNQKFIHLVDLFGLSDYSL